MNRQRGSVGITQELASFVTEVRLEDVPERVVQLAKVHALDALAAGFVGSGLPWSRIVAEMVLEQEGREEVSVFGLSRQVPAAQGALLNGTRISAFEAEYSGHLSHTASTVTPAALAIGERNGSSGPDVLLALIVGSEVGCRIGLSQTKAVEEERGFHNPGVNGPLAAAAAAGKLLGLDAQTQASAFGIAGSHSAGLAEFAWDGSMVKRLHLGRASQHGLESALLASKGFTGPSTVIEGRFGLLHAFSPAPKPAQVLLELGDEWRLERSRMKMYPCKGHGQYVVPAFQELKKLYEVDISAVSRIHIRTSKPDRMLQERYLNPHPTTHLGAQYSLPFVSAVALVRDLDDPLQFDESVLEDKEILRLAPLVTWEAIPPADDGSFRLELQVATDGNCYEVQTGSPVGSLANPATAADIEDKFIRYSQHILAEDRQRHTIETLRDLENVANIRELTEMLRV
jgi:2-methylcitrate dehydratase PrpD